MEKKYLNAISGLLQGAGTNFPETDLYNEGWMLRLVLDYFKKSQVKGHPLSFHEGSEWYSEGLLASPFLDRGPKKVRSLAEGYTHADGVIGHFKIGKDKKGELTLNEDATQIVVIEAKMNSKLSKGVSNAVYYDQAARNVACIVELVRKNARVIGQYKKIAFYLIAPKCKIDEPNSFLEMSRESIERKVRERVQGYEGTKNRWHKEWFQKTINQMEIGVFSWEDIIDFVKNEESEAGNYLNGFYEKCLEYNLKENIF